MKTLHIHSTTKAIQKAQQIFKRENRLLPTLMLFDNFRQKTITVPELIMVSPLQRTLFLLEASDFEEFKKLKIERNFSDFFSNSNSLFHFFEELSYSKVNFDTLINYNPYNMFLEHMKILEKLLNNYKKILFDNGLTDKIFTPQKYTLNYEFIKQYNSYELYLEGDINSFERGLNNGMRQVGFQDVDMVAVTKPITKYSVFIDRIDKLRYELEKAYYLTQEGRKGAVVISIPVNFQYQEDYEPENEISFFNSDEYNSLQKSTTIEEKKILQVVELIKNAQKPVFLIGNGVNLADASVELKQFLKRQKFLLFTH
jgi:hypothetical protein